MRLFEPTSCRQYGPLALIPLIVAGTVGGGFAIANTIKTGNPLGIKNPNANNINPNPTPTASQTVDGSSTSNLNNAGRAALVMTSPQGVQGSDPVNRYALLGNNTGLGNT